MAVLDSCLKHNMIAYLEKTEGNVEFHEIIDFLKRSSIHHALTVSPVVSTTFVEQFWTSAKSKTINNVRHITAKVAGKSVSISEASIRSDLLFDDADGIDTLPNQAIFDAIQQMGYEGDLTVLTFNKALFSPQWRFLFHTINHCLSSKSTSWDQIPTNIATAVICLTSNQKYNFSKLIFDGMLRHLDAKKKFVMYPHFISIFLDKQLANVSVPLDHFLVNTLTSKVFSFMVKKGKHFSGKVTPLFATMLVQPTQDEGASSERPSEALPTPSPAPTSEVPNEPQIDSSPAQTSEVPIEHQPALSPRPSPTSTIPDSIPETSGENIGGHSSSDKSLSGNEGDITLQNVYDLCLSLCAQVSDQAKEIQDLKAQITKLKKQAKPVIKHHKAYLKSVSLKQRFPRKSFSKKHRVHTESVSKQGRKFAKSESLVQRDPLFDKIPKETVDHMETENAQNEGRTREMVDEDKEIDENILSTEDVLSTDKEGVSTDIGKVSTDRPIVSTDGSKVSTDKHIEGTEEHIEGTEEQVESTDGHKKGTEEEIAAQATQTSTQTPTSKIFGDDETIAKVLLNMSQAKAVSREKEKGVELKDVEETDRPKPTSTRSLLTLKPLPKIDPKDKGKKKIEEEDESESEFWLCVDFEWVGRLGLSTYLASVEDHAFEVEPHRNVDYVAGSQEVQTQNLIYYHLARDRDQYSTHELFSYREVGNEAAFAVVAVDKIYAHESLTFNNTVACEVISKWKVGLKDNMDARSDVYMLNNGCKKCKIRATKVLQQEVVQTLLEGHYILSLEGSLSGDCDVEKNSKWSCIYAVGSQEYKMIRQVSCRPSDTPGFQSHIYMTTYHSFPLMPVS
ncbi:hypothetical protein Tco_1199027 [Tanacetum coccineum]